ncbi:MAG: selenobiotic family radical SAM modification target peptide [Proteobacteria bacterium]|nr:selenobiotic family radical SAM modification target peptide [Pseudomonadota bacterium]MBU1738152.1 selenobiotic family radical SAM modification target peptide [Pseudomonadota bacterium]
MGNNDLKKMLAGLSLVALIGGAGLSLTGCAATGNTAATKDNTESNQKVRNDEPETLTG